MSSDVALYLGDKRLEASVHGLAEHEKADLHRMSRLNSTPEPKAGV